MKCRRAAVMLCAFLLAGCGVWSGPAFYTSGDRNDRIPPGTYRSMTDAKPRYFRWDGKQVTDLPSSKKEKEDGPPPILMPLSGAKPEAYIAQFQFGAENAKKSAIYALVSHTRNAWTFVLPDCAATRGIVVDAGGTMDGAAPSEPKAIPAENVSLEDTAGFSDSRRSKRRKLSRHAPPQKITRVALVENPENRYGGQACHFPTTASLEAAARRYFAERQLIGDKIVRIGD